MRASNSRRPWCPRFTTLVLSSLFILFLVFPESRTRSAFLSETGDKTLVSAEEKQALPEGVKVAGAEEVQKPKVDGILSEIIKTEASDVLIEKIILEENKEKQDQEVKTDPRLKIERTGTSGIRRFDSDVAAGDPGSEASQKVKVNPKGIHIGSETHVEVSEVKANHLPDRVDGDDNEEENFKTGRADHEGEIPTIIKSDTKEKVHHGEEDAPLISASEVQQAPADTETKKIIINPDGLGKFENPREKRDTQTENHNVPRSGSERSISTPKPEVSYTIIELLKQNAMLLQEQIRDKTLFETVKEPTLVIPEVPLLTEEDILESLKSVSSTKKHHDLNIEPFSHDLLTDKQLQIIQCSASIIAEQQRQTFISSMYDCVRNLSVMNCMRIFVYPIIAETVPQLIIQNIPGLPVEVTVSDLLPNRNKTKSARSGTFLLYPLLNGEDVIMGMLKDALDTQRSYESVPSYIDPMNETFVKMLSPGQLRILQTAEKLLPVPARREYSDRMYSCVKRFEYYSCLRYFAWPMMKKYYPSLADFPEYLIVYPAYSPYPIVPFSLEPGQLPEVIEADIKARPRPDTLILRILREGIKPGRGQPGYLVPLNLSTSNVSEIANKNETLSPVNLEQMIKTLPFPEKAPYAPITPPLAIPIPQDQLNALLIARQVLPPPLRAEFAAQSLKCVREINYYACMKYYTWPILRQAQPTLPQFPDLSGLFQLPDFSQFFQIPDFSGLFQLPDFSGFTPPSLPMLPSFPGVPTIPMIPTIPTVPGVPTIPTIPTIPGAPTIPSIPGAPTIPSIPGAPTTPSIVGASPPPVEPANTEAPPIVTIRDIHNNQSKSGIEESRHSPVGEPIASNPEDEPRKPSEEPTSTHQDLTKVPHVQISSRKNEIISNVPVISITGNEFVPILSEKSESVIFTILRLYQISDPSLVNTLAISFLNSSTPEYSNFLNLHEENTILLAKSMLPEAARSSFSEQMISCARDKNFVTCSRELMFPTLSEYFPNFPSFPNFVPPVDIKNHIQLNSTENILRNPQISETNIKTDKHGEATLTITDTRFIPIFSEHPEGVVMNILKAVQLSTPILPPTSLKTRDFIRTFEFGKLLSEKQIMILEIGEGLLPEEQRESFLKKMLECSRNNAFLDCSRDIAFPTIHQYYPNLPNFPNFGNQASLGEKQNSGFPDQLLRDGFPISEIDTNSAYFQKIEDHLQNEIENILIRTTSVNERYKSQDDLVSGTLQIAPGFLSKQQRNIMRLSENILPESVRPAYHAKMTECMHSSSFVACMQNVGWPLLRLNPFLLHSIPQPVSDSISQTPGQPIAHSFPPEGYRPSAPIYPDQTINFPNGIDILQQSAPIPREETSQDITSSVGRQVSAPEIPAYAGQPFAPFVDLSKERVDPEEEQSGIKLESQMKIHHSRRKRSSTDLLDSYPEHDPDENKGSVRRNLSKTTFPNMTESELLQFLIHLKNSKDAQLRNSPHPLKKYFIDNLDPEVKNTLTPDQIEILKLVEELNPENSRGIMAQLWQCIRSLSLIRCAGVFIWPMITSNLPSLSPFSGRSEVSSEVQEFFGMPPENFEKELLAKKQEFEDVLLSWYKNLVEQKFETNIGFLRVKGHGNGELGITLVGFREGRAKLIKDNKNLPSILTIISDIMEDVLEPKPKPDRNKKDPKRGKSMRFDINYQFLRDSEEDPKIERSLKDGRILAALLEKLRTNDSDTRNDYGQYFSIQDAYNAFELLFGTRLTSEIQSELKAFSEDHFRSFINRRIPEESPIDDELKIVPLEAQEKILEEKLKIIPPLTSQTYYKLDDELGKANGVKKELENVQFLKNLRTQEKSKNGFKDGSFIRKKKHRTELSIQLPRLNELILSRKITSSIVNMGRGLKDKMMQMMPGVGMIISFLLQMAIAHARTAASVAGMMSNMALGMGMFSMIRDTLFGQPNNPKIKYVYDTESADLGVSWPKEPNYWE